MARPTTDDRTGSGTTHGGLVRRALGLALGVVALVLLSGTTASAADGSTGDAPRSGTVGGLVHDLVGLAPEALADPLRETVRPVTDGVDAVVTPGTSAQAPADDEGSDAGHTDPGTVTMPSPAQEDAAGTVPPEAAPSAGVPAGAPRAVADAGTSGTAAPADQASADRTALAAERPPPADRVPAQHSVDGQALDFGDGSALIAGWNADALAALVAAPLLGPLPGIGGVGPDEVYLGVLHARDHDHDSQHSGRPGTSPD